MSVGPGPLARWTVRPDEVGRALFDVIRARVPRESEGRIRAAIGDRVRVSWAERPAPDLPVPRGGTIVLLPEPLDEEPDDAPIVVLAEGDGWMAVDKPAGVPVHPTRSVRINSVIERLRRTAGDRTLSLAHRLDRGTSGVLLVARDRATASRLGRAFSGGAVRKEYLAVVRGVPAAPSGVIDRPVGRHERSRVRVRMSVGVGRDAVTRWWALGPVAGGTLLRVVPETGRRHQIRVHLESIGHPILGDILYGRPDDAYLDLVARGREPDPEPGSPGRMMLHCARLRLGWPGLRLDVRSPCPGFASPHDGLPRSR